jgi:hypothetical protein
MTPDEGRETTALCHLARYHALWQHLQAAALVARELQAEVTPRQMAWLLSQFGHAATTDDHGLVLALLWCYEVAEAQRTSPHAAHQENLPPLPPWPNGDAA